jgi:hypothetical protein
VPALQHMRHLALSCTRSSPNPQTVSGACWAGVLELFATRGGDLFFPALNPKLLHGVSLQVSWSDSPHVVVMIPGSEEQRGTDLRAALKGHEPFSRCAQGFRV